MDSSDVMAAARDVYNTALEPDDILLRGRIALVTGGGGGIGLGTALALARFGASVAVLEVEPHRCRAAEDALRRLGVEAIAIECDVMNSDRLRAAIGSAADTLGTIDILVNNAGGV